MKKGPIGTIWLDKKHVRNEGTGYGFGTSAGKFSFGDPWNTKWDDYTDDQATACPD